MIAAGIAALMLVSVLLTFHGWPGVASSGPIPRVVAVTTTGASSHARVPTLVVGSAAATPVHGTNVAALSHRRSSDRVRPFTGTSRRPAIAPVTGSAPPSSNSAPSSSGGGVNTTKPHTQPSQPATDPVTAVLNQVTGSQPPSQGGSGSQPTLGQTVDNTVQQTGGAVKTVVSGATPAPVSTPVNQAVDGVTGTAKKLLGG
jgi:hypothetical protein